MLRPGIHVHWPHPPYILHVDWMAELSLICVRSNSNSPRAVSLFRPVQVGVLFQTFFAQEQFDEKWKERGSY